MGINISIPSERKLMVFVDADECDCIGQLVEGAGVKGTTDLMATTEQLFVNVIEQRKAFKAARAKFSHIDYHTLKKKYPGWTSEKIMELKSNFQAFDTNQDGLLHFRELAPLRFQLPFRSDTLDQYEDDHDEEDRMAFFNDMDSDKDGMVDFEEFLKMCDHMLQLGDGMPQIVKTALSGASAAQNVCKLSVLQQLKGGLF